MMVGLPMEWIAVCFVGGLVVGNCCQGMFYLPVAVGVLLVSSCLPYRRGGLFLGLSMLVWGLLGAARVNIQMDLPGAELVEWLRMSGERGNALLTERLRASGLKEEGLGMVTGLALGNREFLSYPLRHAFSEAGVFHLLALSGMHLGILYGLAYMAVVRWCRFSRWRWLVLPFVLLLIWGYAWIARFPDSLVRAALMLSLTSVVTMTEGAYLLGAPGNRQKMLAHSLSFSAWVMLLAEPGCLWDIGFQLSYAAMMALILLPYRPFVVTGDRWWGAMRWVTRMLLISLVAQMGVMPLTTYYFHTLSPGGILLNLLLVPLTSLTIYASLPLLICPIPWLAEALCWLTKAEYALVKGWTELPGMVLHDIYPPLWAVVMIYVFLGVMILRFDEDRQGDWKSSVGAA